VLPPPANTSSEFDPYLRDIRIKSWFMKGISSRGFFTSMTLDKQYYIKEKTFQALNFDYLFFG